MPERSLTGCAFTGGDRGDWAVVQQKTIAGEPLAVVPRLSLGGLNDPAIPGRWELRGVVSHVRYVERPERLLLQAKQEGLGRPGCDCAALLPIRKSEAWWALAQDERRDIFERRSGHIAANMKYLPAIARQLYHCRDNGGAFDFLTWFEFRSEHKNLFDEMIRAFRETEEWKYVDREVDLRLVRPRT